MAETPPSTAPPHPHAGRDRFVRHANLMSVLTVLSRIFGLIRDKFCAMYLGNKTPEWSAFWMGFQLPNLFRRIFGEGALTAIFVPVYTRVLKEKGPEAANRLAAATSTLLVLVLGSLTVIGEVIVLPFAFSSTAAPNNQLAAAMIAIMLPYCVMVCLVALLGAMATVHERFTAQSFSPVILNVFMAAAAAVPVWLYTTKYPLQQRIYWVAGAVVGAGLVQVAQMLPTVWRSGIRLRPVLGRGAWSEAGVWEIVCSMAPMILGLSAVQFNTYMDTQIAWWLSPDGHTPKGMDAVRDILLFGRTWRLPMESGAVGILSVAQRLYMLPVGIFGVSMATAIFPQMAKAVAGNDTAELKRLLVAGLRKTLFISLPASLGMVLIARPLITVIYTADGLDRSTWAAIWFCAGIWAFEGQMVLLRAFYAMHDRMTPLKVAVGMVVLNFTLNLTLVWFLQEGGIALSTTISAIAQCAVLLWILRRRLGTLGLSALRLSILKGLVGCGVMGLAVWGAFRALNLVRVPQANVQTDKLLKALIDLPVIVLVAALAYGLAAWVLRMEELKDVPVVGRILRRR